MVADTSREGASKARLETRDLDLARYAPLLGSMLDDGAVEALGGVVDGVLTATTDANAHTIDGELTIAAPHLKGSLVGGLDIRSERWRIVPKARIEQRKGRTPTGDFGGLLVDLGFARIEGMDAAATTELLGNAAPAVGLRWTLDAGPLLAASGTALPEGVHLAELRSEGSMALPLGDDLPTAIAQLLPALHANARLSAKSIGYRGLGLGRSRRESGPHGGQARPRHGSVHQAQRRRIRPEARRGHLGLRPPAERALTPRRRLARDGRGRRGAAVFPTAARGASAMPSCLHSTAC